MLRCRGLRVEVPGRVVLADVALAVESGEAVAVVGPSGAGKSTLLHALAGIIPAQADCLDVAGVDMQAMSARQRAAHRLRHVGLVFQFGELLPEFTAIENVALPLRFAGRDAASATDRAAAWLQRLGLAERASARPDVLSGGERQRVALARALAGTPDVVLADEPTGSLDRAQAERVAGLLVEQARETGAALLVATHDPRVASLCGRSLELVAGCLAPLPAIPCR